jgi:hypothetical protein
MLTTFYQTYLALWIIGGFCSVGILIVEEVEERPWWVTLYQSLFIFGMSWVSVGIAIGDIWKSVSKDD